VRRQEHLLLALDDQLREPAHQLAARLRVERRVDVLDREEARRGLAEDEREEEEEVEEALVGAALIEGRRGLGHEPIPEP